MTGTLYVVATPLGNREDITARGLRVLKEVDLVACEDTRHTGSFLESFGIRTATTSYFDHNERQKVPVILDALRAGRNVALVTDAGTPAVSDPGYRLVREARAAGIPVIPVPGASAAITAVSVSGLPSDRFLFVGFLPSRAGARRTSLAELAERRETLVVYESPLRVRAALADMLDVLGDREAFLCREATKLHEEYRRGRISELAAHLEDRERVRGEIVLVIGGATAEAAATTEPVEAIVARLIAAGKPRRQAVKEAARLTGLPAREVYRRSLETGE